jgi:hypothetical protein
MSLYFLAICSAGKYFLSFLASQHIHTMCSHQLLKQMRSIWNIEILCSIGARWLDWVSILMMNVNLLALVAIERRDMH